jgi:hypothetical protein
MNATDPKIERFLGEIKAEGRSSPAGMSWQKFHEFLRSKGQPGAQRPPVPLILAAADEPDASKHARLSSQLEWALQNDCLDEAIGYLEAIPANQWNTCPVDRWEQDSYPRT